MFALDQAAYRTTSSSAELSTAARRDLTPQQKAREIFVVRLFFDHFKRKNRRAKGVPGQAAFLQTHRYMVSPTNLSR